MLCRDRALWVLCCDRASRPGTQLGLCARDGTERMIGMRVQQCSRYRDSRPSVSIGFCVATRWGWDWATKVATRSLGHWVVTLWTVSRPGRFKARGLMSRYEICDAIAGDRRAPASARLTSLEQPSVRAGTTEELYRDRKFPVTTESPKFSVTTEEAWPHVATDTPCYDRAWVLEAVGCMTIERLARTTAHGSARMRARRVTARAVSVTALAVCTQRTCDSALCCALFWVTIHEHCSRTLSMDTVKKKKSKISTPRN